jgi:glycerophosphoryl diester phosphodiesterase
VKNCLEFFIIIFLATAFSACERNPIDEMPQEPLVKVIGHRGTGSDGFWLKDPSLPGENTYGAMVFAFHYLNGAETDIQMSADGTIWLWHDDFIGTSTNCVPCLTDAEIIELLPPDKSIVKLIDVLRLLKSFQNKKYLSLDVKGHFPNCNCFNHTQYFNRMSDSIVAFCNRLNINDRVMVETNYIEFLDFIKAKSSKIQCYQLGYSNMRITINAALARGYQGISFNYNDTSFTQQNLNYLRANNLKIQAWSIYSQAGLNRCTEFGVDFIQTGFFSFLPWYKQYGSIPSDPYTEK